MKKYTFIILFLLAFCRLSFASSISVDSFLTGDDVTIAHLESMRSTFQGAINSADGELLQSATVTSSKLDANSNPENRWNESFNDFVYTGLTIPTSASLTSTTVAGTAYIEGVRVVKDATAHTYTASKDTYVDLSKTGTFTYSEVASGATAPVFAANSIRLARISTDTTTVITVDDVRVTSVTLGSGAVTSVSDTDSDTLVQVEESADEDIIRFDTGGTERATIDSTGLNLNNDIYFEGSTADAYETKLTVVDPTSSDKTITLPNETGTVLTSATTLYKIGTFTRDMEAVTADVAYTGVGFTPEFMIFFASGSSIPVTLTAGFDNGTTQISSYIQGNVANSGASGAVSILLATTIGTAQQEGVVKTFGADGFTLTWTKTGSPTAGSGVINYMALK